jgi:hypothetical protein
MKKYPRFGKVSGFKLFILLLLTISLPGFSQAVYVSNSGSDSYTKAQAQNTSTPWKTIQHACNNASPGTTIQIMAGTYYEQINMPVSGSAGGGYITLTNYSGGKVVLNGNADSITLFTISNQSYIKINGLEFYNCVGNNSIGLYMDGKSNHIQITNNTFHHIYWNSSFAAVPNSNENAQTLIVYGDSIVPFSDITITGNNFYDNATGFSETCTLDGNVDTFNISNNLVHNNQNIGIDIAGNYGTCSNKALDHARNGVVKGNKVWKCHSVYDGSAAGIYVDGGENVIVEQNESYNNDWGIEVGCEQPGDTTSNVKVRDNNLYRNGGGMQVGGYDGPVNTGRVINSTISNNTFFNNDTLASGNGELSLSYSEHCSFFNNIFYSTNNTILSSGWNTGNSKNFQFDYNRYYSISGDSLNASFAYGTFAYTGFVSYKSGSAFDAHSIFTNPSLTSTSLSTLNLHLLASSSCINAGMPTFPIDTSERDFDGNTRVISGRIDIGADEYQGPNEVPGISEIGTLKVYPNPVSSKVTIELTTLNSHNTISILNIYEEVVFTTIIEDQTLSVDMSKFAAGVYLIMVNNHNLSKVIKK